MMTEQVNHLQSGIKASQDPYTRDFGAVWYCADCKVESRLFVGFDFLMQVNVDYVKHVASHSAPVRS